MSKNTQLPLPDMLRQAIYSRLYNLGNFWRCLTLSRAGSRLVSEQPAAAVGEDGWAAGKACAVLPTDAGGKTLDATAV